MKLSKVFAGAAFAALLSTGAMAAPTLTVTGGAATTITNFENISTAGYTSASTASSTKYDVGALLKTLYVSDITFTFIGKEAGYKNVFFAFGNAQYNNQVAYGTSVTFSNVAAGVLDYAFQSNGAGPLFGNPNGQIGLMVNGGGTEALALFNDLASDKDYDDMGIQISVTAVPEAETYAMMLAGLGLMGAIVRRRNKAKTA